MQSWLDSRILVMDIGLRFYKRISIYTAAFLFYTTSSGGLLLLVYFEILERDYVSRTETATLGVELIVYGILLYAILYAGAQVNSENEK
mmetsp:Transcript_8401/g.7785  ORF Transcript_8401/g.7785 Transcript_8401/m.7785 type:complete len:89 (-) Transcript_8401:305-571(-)|eukprot:CAMPEP_0170562850 /NCGR_PEP_ID=MMETSP0211-20121228/62783_1 /TAXON_ID=311385 /ORGANISM="Pseudokeronopsis sp., Strain OXSARD2" /LENGTH=88 /DNA_ID=CAMNT_0010880291 /DNA_START=127 /DNA_END=393 /DNA_ORIENTATION=+